MRRLTVLAREGSHPSTQSGGFTLIELLIVMVLLILLAGVSLAVYGNSVTRGKEAALEEDLFQMRKAIDEYYADKGKYPTDLQTLVTEKYLRTIPPDPFTNSAETLAADTVGARPGESLGGAGNRRREERLRSNRGRWQALL